jgi:hypothetical protein
MYVVQTTVSGYLHIHMSPDEAYYDSYFSVSKSINHINVLYCNVCTVMHNGFKDLLILEDS